MKALAETTDRLRNQTRRGVKSSQHAPLNKLEQLSEPKEGPAGRKEREGSRREFKAA